MPKPASVYEEKMARYRREILADAIYQCGGNQTKAAAKLGIHRNSMYRLVASAGVDLVRLKMLLQEKAGESMSNDPLGRGRPRRWTDDMLAKVRMRSGRMSGNEIARELDVSIDALRCACSTYNLSLMRRYTRPARQPKPKPTIQPRLPKPVRGESDLYVERMMRLAERRKA
jgi:transposase